MPRTPESMTPIESTGRRRRSRQRGRRPPGPTLLLAAAILLSPGVVSAQEPMDLSLDRALELALQNSPAYLAMVNDLRSSTWDVRSAWASLAPTVSVGGSLSWQGAGEQRFGSLTAAQLGFADEPAYYFSSYDLSLSQQLDAATFMRPASARAAYALTEARIRMERADLELAVTDAYLEVLRQEEQVVLAERQLERARYNLRLAEGRRDVGQVTVIDVQQAEVQVGRGEVSLLQAQQARLEARLELLRVMGIPLETSFRITTAFDLTEPLWDEAELYRDALEGPLLEESRRVVATRGHDVRMQKSRYLPSLSLSARWSGFTREPSNTDFLIGRAQAQVASQVEQCQALNELYGRLADPLPPQDCSRFVFTDADRRAILEQNTAFPFDFTRQPPSASLSIGIPLFQGLSRQRDIEAAQVAEDDARLGLRGARLSVESAIAGRLGRVRTAYQSALIEERNQELAAEQLRVAQEQYAVGLISFLDLVDAETVRAEADEARIAAVYAYHDAITLLEAIVGRRLRTTGPS